MTNRSTPPWHGERRSSAWMRRMTFERPGSCFWALLRSGKDHNRLSRTFRSSWATWRIPTSSGQTLTQISDQGNLWSTTRSTNSFTHSPMTDQQARARAHQNGCLCPLPQMTSQSRLQRPLTSSHPQTRSWRKMKKLPWSSSQLSDKTSR